ncbi:MAG: hypothetical protein FJW88_10280 [Actinobacteria bacterium]|nr:hypothetical protein [Actinomycetota bacterium]
MKFSDLLGDERPDGEAPPTTTPAPRAAEPIGVLDRGSHLAALNVAPEPAAIPTTAPVEDHVDELAAFDDDLLPSARTRRGRH